MPWLTESYTLRNKRFVLTHSSDKSVHLWSVETGQVIKKWQQKTFQQVQTILNESEFDTPSTVPAQSKKGQEGSVPNPNMPQSWFTCEIRCGSITLHVDEDSWTKGQVTTEEYERVS